MHWLQLASVKRQLELLERQLEQRCNRWCSRLNNRWCSWKQLEHRKRCMELVRCRLELEQHRCCKMVQELHSNGYVADGSVVHVACSNELQLRKRPRT